MTSPDPPALPFVSTGRLPEVARVQDVVEECHRDIGAVTDGVVSDVYPALAEADPALFGVAVVDTHGHEYIAGDVDVTFSVMSVAKPFVFALACQRHGIERVVDHVGVEATGRPFNSVAAVEQGPGGRTNPMVNAGAIACTALLEDGTDSWAAVRDGLSAFAGRRLSIDEDVLASASLTNLRNQAIARLLHAMGQVTDPDRAVDLYTRQSCLAVTARDLAVMGATLADAGVNPVTGEPVVSADVAARTLAVMTIAGMYERSGDWLVRVGLPGKSGIGGGMVTAAPGKGGLGTFSPPLDPAGNSVRGVLTAETMSRRLGLDLFRSAVAASAPRSGPSARRY